MSVLFQYLSIIVHHLLSNSIKRMINGFVGKFDIDDGIYDSEDFRLVFNSIAATCKATENLSLYQTSACKSSVIQSINQSTLYVLGLIELLISENFIWRFADDNLKWQLLQIVKCVADSNSIV
ncbi:hypothetical protein BLOT_002638 [Blomia tropicalis]|nr:hypothetical protein BLOT_002638 [Blomia tropicalis]